MKSSSGKSTKKNWTYAEAVATVPHVKSILTDLRIHYIAIYHFCKVVERNKCEYIKNKIQYHGTAGAALMEELKEMDIVCYQKPHRGIVLYPFLLGGKTKAYFVFKDSRDTIDSYITLFDLCEYCDLYLYEKPITEKCK